MNALTAARTRYAARDVVREAESICRAAADALRVLEEIGRARRDRERVARDRAAVVAGVIVLCVVALLGVAL